MVLGVSAGTILAGTAGAADAGSIAAALGIASVGLSVTVGSIAGIVALARKIGSRGMSGGMTFAAVVGILFLAGFALAGLAATGCGVMLSHW
jgi:hypothetical protein